jgi:uncharacterized protein with von Willebrand factor type A (vWA) domain
MLPGSAFKEPGAGQHADNVLHFARVLRKAGLPVGTDRPMLALAALGVAGIGSRADLYATLKACLIDRVEHLPLFDQAFHVFWRDPDLLDQVLRLLLPSTGAAGTQVQPPAAINRRLTQALLAETRQRATPAPPRERIEVDAHFSWSDREQLRKADFDTMTTAEWLAARRMVAALEPWFARILTRRDAPATRGTRADLRRLLHEAARRGGDIVVLPRRLRRARTAPLVVIVDISGSMSRYSRMFLHFIHALASGSQAADLRVGAFVYGTRLTNVTRQLRARDPDEAIARIVGHVADWSGGTRIGASLKDFNRLWARRVPLASATVLLVTDGLEHTELDVLSAEAARLARSCRRLVWLNPLLRYERFEPRARGIVALLPHVERMLPVHNVESLEQLARILTTAQRSEQPAWN